MGNRSISGRGTDQKSQYVVLMIIQNSEYSAEVGLYFTCLFMNFTLKLQTKGLL
jgi:hypothetical protein